MSRYPWARAAIAIWLRTGVVFAACTHSTQLSRVRECRGNWRRPGKCARTGRLFSRRSFLSLAGSGTGSDCAHCCSASLRVGNARLRNRLCSSLRKSIRPLLCSAADKRQRSIASSQLTDFPGAGPAQFNFHASPKPARFTHPSCTGPPQIGFVFNLSEAAWDHMFDELRVFAESNGGEAHGDPERPALARWCHKQARRSLPARQLTEPGRFCAWTVIKPEELVPAQILISQQPCVMQATPPLR